MSDQTEGLQARIEARIERNLRGGYAGDMTQHGIPSERELPPLEEDIGREPAPWPLELVRRFINSREIVPVHEEFSSPEALGGWIRDHGLPGGEAALTEDDLRRARDYREALRSLTFTNNGEPLDEDAVAAANREAARSRLVLRVDERGHGELVPGGEGIEATLGTIASIVAASMIDGSWARLKACRSPTCVWAFYDHSKNRSGHWCAMAVCGSREKSREYRKRRKERADSATS